MNDNDLPHAAEAALPPATCSAVEGLRYIAESPLPGNGGFHPETVRIAKAALAEIESLREACFVFLEARKHGGYGMGDAEQAVRAALFQPNASAQRRDQDEGRSQ